MNKIFCLIVALPIFINLASAESTKIEDFSCKDCNVIFIGFDALQFNHTTMAGYSRDVTPTLNQLAQEGILFTNHYAVASWTVPSFMSYFTSLYPSEHRLVNKFSVFDKTKKELADLRKLSPEVQTLAQAFKAAGYKTGGFTGDAGVSAQFGYSLGFDEYTDEKPFGSFSRSAKHAQEWLKKIGKQKFFMFFHGYDVHGQFTELVENYKSQFHNANYKGKYKITPDEQRILREEGLVKTNLEISKEDVEAWISWYDGKIKDADQRLKDFLDKIKEMGLLENTLIVAVSDHGTEFFEHGKMDHGFSLYNELIHVPVIIKWPGRLIGKKNSVQIRSIDILPTIFNIIGLEKNEKWQRQIRGESLLPLIAETEAKTKTKIKQQNRPVFAETDYRNYSHKRAYLNPDGQKLIITMESGEKELFDLNKDPLEKNNLVKKDPKKVYEMTQTLFDHIKKTGQSPLGPWPIGCLPVYQDQCI